MAFPKFDTVLKKLSQNEDIEDISVTDTLSAMVEIMPAINLLQRGLECEIDANFIRRYFPDAHGDFDGFELMMDGKNGPQIIAKFEHNTSCNCHPEYEHTYFSIPVDLILEGAEGVKRFRAIEDAKIAAKEEEQRLAKEEKERKHREFMERREREDLARLKKKYET